MPGLPSRPDDCGPVIAQSSFSPGHPRSLWLIPCDFKSSSPPTRCHRVEGILFLHKHSESTFPPTICYLLVLAVPEALWEHSPQSPLLSQRLAWPFSMDSCSLTKPIAHTSCLRFSPMNF
jgi:hypothetical protein